MMKDDGAVIQTFFFFLFFSNKIKTKKWLKIKQIMKEMEINK